MTYALTPNALLAAAYCVLAARIFQTGLARRYRYFTIFLAFEAICLALTTAISRDADLYGYIYFATQAVVWLLYALMTLEVFNVALQHHQGIASAVRWLIAICVGTSVAVASATLAFNVQRHQSPYEILENFFVLERVVHSSLLCFVFLLVAALGWFPVPLTRNAVIHAGVFAFFFASQTGILLVRNVLGPEFTIAGNWIIFLTTLISLILWGTLLSQEGEAREVRSGISRDPADEERLMAQIDSLNQTLVGSSRR